MFVVDPTIAINTGSHGVERFEQDKVMALSGLALKGFQHAPPL